MVDSSKGAEPGGEGIEAAVGPDRDGEGEGHTSPMVPGALKAAGVATLERPADQEEQHDEAAEPEEPGVSVVKTVGPSQGSGPAHRADQRQNRRTNTTQQRSHAASDTDPHCGKCGAPRRRTFGSDQ